jgi:hypothetical protein
LIPDANDSDAVWWYIGEMVIQQFPQGEAPVDTVAD